MSQKSTFRYSLLFCVVFIAVFGLPMCGSSLQIPLVSPDFSDIIYWKLRFPQNLLAMVVGGGLAIAGLTFQAVFRNPLATPYTLGIASGASFGAVLFLQIQRLLRSSFDTGAGSDILGFSGWFSHTGMVWFAFGGSGLAMIVVFLLSRSSQRTAERMLLAGVAVNYFFAGLILLIQYVTDPANAMRMLRWTMGSLTDPTLFDVVWVAVLVAVYYGFLMFYSRSLDILVTGAERAMALGIDVRRMETTLFIATSLLVGGIVSVCGPIGFVGLMVPHLCRLLVGTEHRFLLPTVLVGGCLFLAVCDTAARSLFADIELPIGIITSMVGGPFFLWLLFRRHET